MSTSGLPKWLETIPEGKRWLPSSFCQPPNAALWYRGQTRCSPRSCSAVLRLRHFPAPKVSVLSPQRAKAERAFRALCRRISARRLLPLDPPWTLFLPGPRACAAGATSALELCGREAALALCAASEGSIRCPSALGEVPAELVMPAESADEMPPLAASAAEEPEASVPEVSLKIRGLLYAYASSGRRSPDVASPGASPKETLEPLPGVTLREQLEGHAGPRSPCRNAAKASGAGADAERGSASSSLGGGVPSSQSADRPVRPSLTWRDLCQPLAEWAAWLCS